MSMPLSSSMRAAESIAGCTLHLRYHATGPENSIPESYPVHTASATIRLTAFPFSATNRILSS